MKKKNIWNKPVWFHFMKTLKSKGVIRQNESAAPSEVAFLSENEKELFNTQKTSSFLDPVDTLSFILLQIMAGRKWNNR